MSKTENGMCRETLKGELLRRAREDDGFRKLVMDHPQEACGHMGFCIPGAAGQVLPYLSTVEQMYRRHEFYGWYYEHVLGALRSPDEMVVPQNLGHWENMDWDFEVTRYAPAAVVTQSD
jgi:hypothetical protein